MPATARAAAASQCVAPIQACGTALVRGAAQAAPARRRRARCARAAHTGRPGTAAGRSAAAAARRRGRCAPRRRAAAAAAPRWRRGSGARPAGAAGRARARRRAAPPRRPPAAHTRGPAGRRRRAAAPAAAPAPARAGLGRVRVAHLGLNPTLNLMQAAATGAGVRRWGAMRGARAWQAGSRMPARRSAVTATDKGVSVIPPVQLRIDPRMTSSNFGS